MKRTRAILDRWTAWTPVLLLASLAALTFWLDAQIQPPDDARKGDQRHDPDVFMTNFRAVNFDDAGQVRQALTAKRAQHHPDDDTVDFTSPSLVVTDRLRPKLTVTSDAGTLSGDRQTVLFRGNVEAIREVRAGTRDSLGPVRLTTDFLRVIPDKGIAETDRPVTIEDPHGIIHGIGVTLDNQSRTMQIKSAVRGTFQPTPPR
ncbi:MAG: LPS export ABC transporter periplasmic protein LptC [Casimicrobiaceae bacterium]